MLLKFSSISKDKVFEFLLSKTFFGKTSPGILKEIAEGFELRYLAGGELLFQQHESADCLYILMSGLLRAIQEDSNGIKTNLGDIVSGNVVGEIACLIDQARTASIYAIRDSILLKMTRSKFDYFLEKYPGAMINIAKLSISRLVQARHLAPKNKLTCFALIPASDFKDLQNFAYKFVDHLLEYGSTLLLTEEKFDELIGAGASKISAEHEKNNEILAKIQELEDKYKFLVYVVENKNSWAYRCIRQVDKILLIGDYKDSPQIGEIERILQSQENKLKPNVDLVLLCGNDIKKPVGTKAWRANRNLSEQHHIRENNEADYKRFIRLITGNGLGVVLSGGGANALAHLGMLQALEELGIHYDYIGGTSMGAIIAGLAALEYDVKTISLKMQELLKKFSSTLDYTFPISSLVRGRNTAHLLRLAYGEDTMIEDLWQNFFCVSTNLSANSIYVHDQNLLWKAVRASISIPAIFPAVHNEYNDLFVDGGILNNLPVDVMQNKVNGCKILSSSLKVRYQPLPSFYQMEDDTTSGWYLLLKHFLIPKRWKSPISSKKIFPSIQSVIHASMNMGSMKYQQSMLKAADYNIIFGIERFGMLDFKPVQDIIDNGYREAMKQLEKTDLFKK